VLERGYRLEPGDCFDVILAGYGAAMLVLLLALSLAAAPACVGDGHNHHRSQSAIKRFQKFWARAQ
jgi:hypothetical protein